MAVFVGSYVPIQLSTNPDATISSRINYIVDNLITPRILEFRQITVYDEQATLMPDELTWRLTYKNWNTTFPFIVNKNKSVVLFSTLTNVDYVFGTFQAGCVCPGDNYNLTYNFDYFGIGVLTGFIYQALETINASAIGSATNYQINTAPQWWDGVIADLAVALAMERLILDYDLWHGRLVFAIGGSQVEEGGGDIISQLELLKRNAEERAFKSLENERFKVPYILAKPTPYYYQAIRGIGRSGAHNVSGYGKTRGWQINKYM